MYWQLRDAFVLTSDTEPLLLDLAPDLFKTDEALLVVKEQVSSSAAAGRPVDRLENERVTTTNDMYLHKTTTWLHQTTNNSEQVKTAKLGTIGSPRAIPQFTT
jgi:hypothetical protein